MIKFEISCVNCESYKICKVREYMLSGNSKGNDYIKIITCDPDKYSELYGGLNRLIASCCRFYKEDEID
jgi:hypothetical protein